MGYGFDICFAGENTRERKRVGKGSWEKAPGRESEHHMSGLVLTGLSVSLIQGLGIGIRLTDASTAPPLA